MTHFDATAQVYEAFADAAATEYLGAYATLGQALDAVAERAAEGPLDAGDFPSPKHCATCGYYDCAGCA